MFRIHDVLIRILGSVHWIKNLDIDPDPDPALLSGFQDAKIFFFFSVILLFIVLTVDTFTSVFKDNKSLKSQISRNQGIF